MIDPKLPAEGLDALAADRRPQQGVLTSGDHTRDADRFAEAFGAPIRVTREGAERIAGALEVEAYRDGEDVAPGVRAVHVGVLSPDEYALHVTASRGNHALALDRLTHYGAHLSFVPDELMGGGPEAVKTGLVERFQTLLELDFEHLLFAHGDPIVGEGKAALRAFVRERSG